MNISVGFKTVKRNVQHKGFRCVSNEVVLFLLFPVPIMNSNLTCNTRFSGFVFSCLFCFVYLFNLFIVVSLLS